MPRRPGSAPLRRTLSETRQTLTRVRSGARLGSVLRHPYPAGGFGAQALRKSQQRKVANATRASGENSNGNDLNATAHATNKRRPASASGARAASTDGNADALILWRQSVSRFRRRMEYARTAEHQHGRAAPDESSTSPPQPSPGHAISPTKRRRARHNPADGTTTLEFMPGTGLIYGSQVAFRSTQRKFLAVDRATGQCVAVGGPTKEQALASGNVPPAAASRLFLYKALDVKDRSPVCYGDSVWLALGAEAETFLGVKMVAHKGDARGSHSSSLAIPSAVRRKTQRGLEIARWLVVCANRGHAEKAKGKPVRHLGTVRLEIEWNCLAAKSNGENQPVQIIMQPAGGMAVEAQRTRRMSETGSRGSVAFAAAAAATADHVAQKEWKRKLKAAVKRTSAVAAVAHGSGSGGHGKRRKNGVDSKGNSKGGATVNTPTSNKKKAGGSRKLDAGWGATWTIFLAELANETEEDNGPRSGALTVKHARPSHKKKKNKTRGPADRGQQAVLRAQDGLLASRRNRRARGDLQWVHDIHLKRIEREMEGAAMCAAAADIRRGGNGIEKKSVDDDDVSDDGERRSSSGTKVADASEPMGKEEMASFMLARFKVASEEQFLYRKRGTYWSKKDESDSLVPGAGRAERGSNTFITDGYSHHSPSRSHARLDGKLGHAASEGGRSVENSRARRPPLDDAESAQSHSTLAGHGLEQWPLKGMTKRERARAVAQAAVLESQIKSSVWAVVGRHQTFLDAQEEHRMLVAVTALQRAVRAWIRTRWQRKFTGEDVSIAAQIIDEKEQEAVHAAAAKTALSIALDGDLATASNGEAGAPSRVPLRGLPPTRAAAPVVRLVPKRSLRWEFYAAHPVSKDMVVGQSQGTQQKPSSESLTLAEVPTKNPENGTFRNLLHPTPESSEISDASPGLSAGAGSNSMFTTSSAPTQPEPAIMDLGSSLWASTLPDGASRSSTNVGERSGYDGLHSRRGDGETFGSVDDSRMVEAGVLPRARSSHLRKLRLLPPNIGADSASSAVRMAIDPGASIFRDESRGRSAKNPAKVFKKAVSAPFLDSSSSKDLRLVSDTRREAEDAAEVSEDGLGSSVDRGLKAKPLTDFVSGRPQSAPMKRRRGQRSNGRRRPNADSGVGTVVGRGSARIGSTDGMRGGSPSRRRRRRPASSRAGLRTASGSSSTVGKARSMLEETNKFRDSLALRHTKKLDRVRSNKSAFAAKLQMHLMHSAKYSNFSNA